MKIIDSHCHIYPEKIAKRATDATGNFYGIKFQCEGTVQDLEKRMEQAGIDISVVESVATSPSQVTSINNFIANACSKYDNLVGLGTLHPDSEDQEADVLELIKLGLHGVKLHPDIQKFKIDDYRCLKIYELCEKYHLPILMHTGDSRYDYSNPNRLRPILEIYDKLVVIGAHFGGWSIWKTAVSELKNFKNLYVDTSSALYALKPNEAFELIEKYGDDKVLFGTDFPMWIQKEELERFMAINLTEKQREKLFSINAKKVFNIK